MATCKLEVVLLLEVRPSEDTAELEENIESKVEELAELDGVARVYLGNMEYLD
jgi:hypothetical protein